MTQNTSFNELEPEDKSRKIESLRDMISSAEKTIQGAKAMLLQLEGKKKVGRRRKVENTEEGTVVEGTFDGQVMIGTDGRQYPVPVNYASKSKLVETDMLKLTITPDGSFIYKQIGPVNRKNIIGIVNQDEVGNYFITAEGKAYKVLLASITYFKAEVGDEVVIVIPNNTETTWAAIENVLRKASDVLSPQKTTNKTDFEDHDVFDGYTSKEKEHNYELTSSEMGTQKEEPHLSKSTPQSIIDEWTPSIEEIEAEIRAEEEKQL